MSGDTYYASCKFCSVALGIWPPNGGHYRCLNPECVVSLAETVNELRFKGMLDIYRRPHRGGAIIVFNERLEA